MAKKIADSYIKVEMIEVNRETQEETVRDSVSLDISCLLFPAGPNVESQWTFDKMKPMSLHYLSFKVTSD
jgi:hypothetical protein